MRAPNGTLFIYSKGASGAGAGAGAAAAAINGAAGFAASGTQTQEAAFANYFSSMQAGSAMAASGAGGAYAVSGGGGTMHRAVQVRQQPHLVITTWDRQNQPGSSFRSKLVEGDGGHSSF